MDLLIYAFFIGLVAYGSFKIGLSVALARKCRSCGASLKEEKRNG